MIAYFDTSAIVPLLIAEIGTRTAGDIWDRADRLVSVRLAHVEARAALAQAARMRRISPQHLRSSVRELGDLFAQVDVIEADEDLIHEAGERPKGYAPMTLSTSPPSAGLPTWTWSWWRVTGRC